MSRNEGTTDRIVRVIVGVAMLALGWMGFVDGWLGTVLQWLGFVPLLTGLVGWCPLYALFGFRTNGHKAQPSRA
ncbi:MAG: YgaP family membrane protein [Caldilineaceae bacterium]